MILPRAGLRPSLSTSSAGVITSARKLLLALSSLFPFVLTPIGVAFIWCSIRDTKWPIYIAENLAVLAFQFSISLLILLLTDSTVICSSGCE